MKNKDDLVTLSQAIDDAVLTQKVLWIVFFVAMASGISWSLATASTPLLLITMGVMWGLQELIIRSRNHQKRLEKAFEEEAG